MTKTVVIKQNPQLAALIIRIGLAAVFIYAAIDAFREPLAWEGFLPTFANKLISPKTLLDVIAVFQLILAAWLLTGKYLRYAAGITILLFAGIIVFNPHTFLITFRDIGLIAAAMALYFL